MSDEILVNVTPMETRVALVENGATQDIHIERSANRGHVGNIYAGKVVRVMPGMQAAFIDLGTDRTGFIHVADIVSGSAAVKAKASIGDHLHDGKKVIVQVTKDPLGSKGARLSTELSVSSRYLVYMPGGDHVGISQQIDDPDERERLQQMLAEGLEQEPLDVPGGFILRTAAEGTGLEEILADLRFLKRLWAAVSRRAKAASRPELLYEDLPLHLRTIRDLARPGVEKIRIDSRESYDALRVFCDAYVPEVAVLLEHYHGDRPLFDIYGIEDDIRKALERKVELKSGGYLIIDQTEAMTTIDVNTGSFVGRRNQAETILKTNLEAATTLARQLRMRNLGGIIIVDFIDMQDEEHRRQVHRTLEKAMSRDPARNKITGVSELGLVEMTRKRTRESLGQVLCEPCPTCNGKGQLKTPETVCYEVFREILRAERQFTPRQFLVLASQEVVDLLLDEESTSLAELEAFIGKPIKFQVEQLYTQEQFDVVLV